MGDEKKLYDFKAFLDCPNGIAILPPMEMKNIIIIEDDLLSRINLEQRLKVRGNVIMAASKEEAKAKIGQNKNLKMAFVDLDLDRELEGLSLISILKSQNIYTVILSAREEDDVIRKAYENGCDDYMVKPFNNRTIEHVFKKYNQINLKQSMIKMLSDRFKTTDTDLLSQIEIIANSLLSDRPILITGETGTGKTYLAKMIHELSGEQLPFVEINCSEFSESLLESELFGHEKGAFTGAIKSKKGLIEQANGGILFLDEIGTMSSSLQKKLLKAVEEKVFYPVGSEKPINSNFRLISATCEDLKVKIEKGEFRQDLYFRIEGFNIFLKPLRERANDISLLIKSFIKDGERRFVINDDGINLFKEYSWPGNVRELEKTIEILRTKDQGIITFEDVKLILNRNSDMTKKDEFYFDFEEIKRVGLNAFVQEVEMKIVEEMLKANQEKVRKTLSDLKLSNNTFYRIMDNIKSKRSANV